MLTTNYSQTLSVTDKLHDTFLCNCIVSNELSGTSWFIKDDMCNSAGESPPFISLCCWCSHWSFSTGHVIQNKYKTAALHNIYQLLNEVYLFCCVSRGCVLYLKFTQQIKTFKYWQSDEVNSVCTTISQPVIMSAIHRLFNSSQCWLSRVAPCPKSLFWASNILLNKKWAVSGTKYLYFLSSIWSIFASNYTQVIMLSSGKYLNGGNMRGELQLFTVHHLLISFNFLSLHLDTALHLLGFGE